MSEEGAYQIGNEYSSSGEEESQEEDNDEEVKEGSEELKRLFERYRVSDDENELFHKLKEAGKDLPLNDEEIITCMVCKKTFEKTLALMKSYSFLVTEHRFGRYELEKKHIELLQDGYFFSHPAVKGLKGETVMFAKVSNFEYSKLKDDEQTIIDANFLFLHRLCFGNVDTCRKGIICCSDSRGLRLWEIPWDLNRRMAPLFLKVPFRLKKNICMYPPWYFHVVMKLLKVFMSPKIMGRVVLTHDLDEVRGYVNQLPTQVGGKFEMEMLDALRSVIVRSENDGKLFDEFMKDLEEKKRRKKERRRKRKERKKKKKKKKKRLRLKKLFRKKKKKKKMMMMENDDDDDDDSEEEEEDSGEEEEEEEEDDSEEEEEEEEGESSSEDDEDSEDEDSDDSEEDDESSEEEEEEGEDSSDESDEDE